MFNQPLDVDDDKESRTILFFCQPIRIQSLCIHNGIIVDCIEAQFVKSYGINAELYLPLQDIFETRKIYLNKQIMFLLVANPSCLLASYSRKSWKSKKWWNLSLSSSPMELVYDSVPCKHAKVLDILMIKEYTATLMQTSWHTWQSTVFASNGWARITIYCRFMIFF